MGRGWFALALGVGLAAGGSRPATAQPGYEQARSLAAAGSWEECAEAAEAELKREPSPRIELYGLAASCQAHAGDLHRAATLLRKARREFPEDPGLAYDAAEVEVGMRDWDQARELLKVAIAGRPRHAPSHFLLGLAYRGDNYVVPSVIATLRYLSLAPEGEHAQDAAQAVADFLLSGASRGAEGEVKIAVDPNRPKDEGDYSAVELLIALSAATHLVGQQPHKPEIGTLVEQLGQLLAILTEAPPGKGKPSFVAQTYVPVFAKLTRAGFTEPFGYLAFAPLGLAGTEDWLKEHRERVDQLKAWLAAN